MVLGSKKLKETDWLPLFTALMLICIIGPFYVWKLLGMPLVRYVIVVMGCWPFLKYRRRLTQKDQGVISLFAFAIITYLFGGCIHGCSVFGLMVRLLMAFPIVILFSRPEFVKKVFDVFFTIFSVLMFLSVFSYVLFLLGLSPELGMLTSPLEPDREYIHFPFLVMEKHMVDMFRFAGPFDEPGVVGTISALVLCAKNYNLRDWRSIVVLIAGILSTSLFFYLLSLFYLVAYSLIVKKKLWVVAAMVFAGVLFYDKTKDNPIVYDRVWRRLEWNASSHQIEGDSRTSVEGRKYYKSTIGSLEWFFGLDDPSYYNNITKGSSSYMNIIMWHGALFFFLYAFSILLFIKRQVPSLSKRFILYFVIVVNLYQRPDLFGMSVFFFYASMACFSRGEASPRAIRIDDDKERQLVRPI